MGFDVQGIKFLLRAQRNGVRFTRTATIGRQELFVDPTTLHRLFRSAGLAETPATTGRILKAADGFAEPLLRRLGAEQITSVDASSYEQASVVHDLNQPVPDRLRNAFSAVIDAGTLEHVFNFPVAMRNCMEMVQVGGHLLLMTPTNNFMGHGFYQFSPELFFRILSDQNGYELVKAIVCETDSDAPWYEVVDPARARRRVEMLTSKPAYMLVLARRTRDAPLFAVTPQQSDYTVLWESGASGSAKPWTSAAGLPVRVMRGAGRRLESAYRRVLSLVPGRSPDPDIFIEVRWDDV